MIKSTKIYRVTVYHDETKDVPGEKRKGHVLLFVPETVEVSQQTPSLWYIPRYSKSTWYFHESYGQH